MNDTIHRDQRQRMTVAHRIALAIATLALIPVALPRPALASEPEREIAAGEDFGAGLTLSHLSSLADVVAHPERYADEPILVRGRVAEVCQHRGCWAVLSAGDANLRIRFKDYGFFLPKDCSGKQAYAEGVVTLETESEETARHHASESRDGDPSAIRAPQQGVGFTASGVRLVDPD